MRAFRASFRCRDESVNDAYYIYIYIFKNDVKPINNNCVPIPLILLQTLNLLGETGSNSIKAICVVCLERIDLQLLEPKVFGFEFRRSNHWATPPYTPPPAPTPPPPPPPETPLRSKLYGSGTGLALTWPSWVIGRNKNQLSIKEEKTATFINATGPVMQQIETHKRLKTNDF